MLRIELDWLLDYLLTGEESEHQEQVRDLLPRQRDCQDLLRQARAALEVLGEDEIGAAVMGRLEWLESRARPGPRGPVFARPFITHTKRVHSAGSVPPEVMRNASIEPVLRRKIQPSLPDAAISEAVAAGSGQVRHGKRRRLSKPIRRGPFSPDMDMLSAAKRSAPDEAIVSYMQMDLVALPAAGLHAAGMPPPDRDDIDLRHEELAPGEDRLLVTLPNPPTGPALVTWIPDSGEVAQAHVDASGTATLPWPQPGPGVLRIDAARTTVIPLLIDM